MSLGYLSAAIVLIPTMAWNLQALPSGSTPVVRPAEARAQQGLGAGGVYDTSYNANTMNATISGLAVSLACPTGVLVSWTAAVIGTATSP